MNPEEQGKKMSQLIAKCWADEGFKQKVLADPATTLRAEGVELPPGLSIKAVENTDKVCHLVIPAKPTDLLDEELKQVVGGFSTFGLWQSGGGGKATEKHSHVPVRWDLP